MTWRHELAAYAETIFYVLLAIVIVRFLYGLLHLCLAIIVPPLSPRRSRSEAMWRRYAHRAPSISIVAPAYNEALTVIESVTSLLGQTYPDFEVIVVNDGSRDDTLRLLIDHFALEPVARRYNLWVEHAPIRGLYASEREPRLLVVDKVNGGCKADAANAGINVARKAWICTIDVDSMLDRDTLRRMVRPVMQDPQRTIAVGGSIRVINGCKVENGRVVEANLPRAFLARVQTLEYLRAFLIGRVAMSRLGTLTIVSGALGLFKRRVLLEVGGYGIDTCGEDYELIVRMHRHMREQRVPYCVAFVPDPVCWTEVPETLAGLGSQRARWQRGSIETFAKHRRMALNPAYGRIGILGFGRSLATDFFGPVSAMIGYLLVPAFYLAGLLNLEYTLAFMGVALSFTVFISVSTLILEEIESRRFGSAGELAILTWISIAENFGYRQLANLWRMRGFYDYFRGNTGWQEIARKGFRR